MQHGKVTLTPFTLRFILFLVLLGVLGVLGALGGSRFYY
jgi:hypothetical protein